MPIKWLLPGELGDGNRGMPATFLKGRLTGETDLTIYIPIAVTLRQTFPDAKPKEWKNGSLLFGRLLERDVFRLHETTLLHFPKMRRTL